MERHAQGNAGEGPDAVHGEADSRGRILVDTTTSFAYKPEHPGESEP